jgi:hypothetical protein
VNEYWRNLKSLLKKIFLSDSFSMKSLPCRKGNFRAVSHQREGVLVFLSDHLEGEKDRRNCPDDQSYRHCRDNDADPLQTSATSRTTKGAFVPDFFVGASVRTWGQAREVGGREVVDRICRSETSPRWSGMNRGRVVSLLLDPRPRFVLISTEDCQRRVLTF